MSTDVEELALQAAMSANFPGRGEQPADLVDLNGNAQPPINPASEVQALRELDSVIEEYKAALLDVPSGQEELRITYEGYLRSAVTSLGQQKEMRNKMKGFRPAEAHFLNAIQQTSSVLRQQRQALQIVLLAVKSPAPSVQTTAQSGEKAEWKSKNRRTRVKTAQAPARARRQSSPPASKPTNPNVTRKSPEQVIDDVLGLNTDTTESTDEVTFVVSEEPDTRAFLRQMEEDATGNTKAEEKTAAEIRKEELQERIDTRSERANKPRLFGMRKEGYLMRHRLNRNDLQDPELIGMKLDLMEENSNYWLVIPVELVDEFRECTSVRERYGEGSGGKFYVKDRDDDTISISAFKREERRRILRETRPDHPIVGAAKKVGGLFKRLWKSGN